VGRSHFDPTQPRGGDGRWVPTGRSLESAISRAGAAEVYHVPFARVRRPAKLSRLVGIDVRGFRFAASNQAIRHTFAKHGVLNVERQRGLVPIDHADILRLPQIVRAATYAPGKARKFGPPRVEITATVGTYHYTVIAEVRRGQRRLDLVSMWKR